MANKPFKIKERIASFKPAIIGLIWFAKNEHNARIHFFAVFLVILSGIFLKINVIEWFGIIICIGMVITAEIFNSSIEKLVDFISPEKNEMAGLVKDLAAAAVLISSIISVVVAAIVFIPKLLLLF